MLFTITTGTLPADMQVRYEITETIPGGPVVSLIQYGQSSVDFSNLTPAVADALIAGGFPYLRKKAEEAVTPVEQADPPEVEEIPDAGPNDPDNESTAPAERVVKFAKRRH